MAYFKAGVFADDPWVDTTILTLAEWQDNREALPSPVGLQIDPGASVELLAGHLGQVSVIKIAFPKFTDGRGYSMGWLLRARLGYKGEMRAVGDVLFDEMQFMVRCGFDAFDIVDKATLQLLRDGRRAAAFDRFYQPGLKAEIPVGTRSWARRQAPPGNLA